MAGCVPQDSDGGGFFDEIQAAAILKHGILRRYLPVYATKTGTYARGRMVIYFDGYAGQGRYEDGRPGSPLIAAGVARTIASQRNPRKLRLFLVEKDRASEGRLRQLMAAEAPDVQATVHGGDAEEFLGLLLAECAGLPLFGFLDPYGRGLPPRPLIRLMNRTRDRHGRPQTELLINFSDPMIRRTGGLLTSASPQPQDPVTLARMDAVCGGDWWRQAYTAARSNSTGVRAVVSGYRQRLERATSSRTWCVPVRNRGHQEPRYYLIFLSRHPDGLWEFGEAVSSAAEEWRKFVDNAEFGEADTLFDWDAHLTATIKGNIAKLVAEEAAPFVIRARYEAVMGDALALARGKHIRAAVKQLHAEGRTATDGRGDIDTMVIKPPARD
jgi:three-Cys-motif partner protein